MTLFGLFVSFLKIGLFTIGGGYASLPLIREALVDSGYISMEEFADILAIAEMTPGPIALNAATFVGTKLFGFLGALAATGGFVLPPLIIVLTLALLYYRFKKMKTVESVLKMLRPAVTAFIASAGLSILVLVITGGEGTVASLWGIDFFAVVAVAVCVVILRVKKLNPILLMLGSGIIGGLYYYINLHI